MKLGIISDTHNQEEFVKKAVLVFRKEKVDCVIHCGDVTSPELLREFSGFDKLIVVKGNMDRYLLDLKRVCEQVGGKYYDDYADLTIDGKQIAVLHSDNVKRFSDLIESGQYDYIFYGHTHIPVCDKYKNVYLVNPGAWNSNSICVVDLDADIVTHKKIL